MKPALIVVDMQVRFEQLARKADITDNIVEVIDFCHKSNVPVFITQHHDPDSTSVLYNWWARTPLPKDCDEWDVTELLIFAVKMWSSCNLVHGDCSSPIKALLHIIMLNNNFYAG